MVEYDRDLFDDGTVEAIARKLALPLTRNGKVDRAALPAPVATARCALPDHPGSRAGRTVRRDTGCARGEPDDDFFRAGRRPRPVRAWRPLDWTTVGGAGLAVAAAVLAWSGRIVPAALGRWLAPHAVPLAVTLLALLLMAVAIRRVWTWGRDRRSVLGAPTMVAAAVIVALSGWAAVDWLLGEADQAAPAQRAPARVEAIKTGLAVAAGVGAVFALLLAVRRQWHQEASADDTVYDATERRITDLYTKAVEQLGSDKAAVRLGGLYVLERLGQVHPTQRETILNVICAYLGMPVPRAYDPKQWVVTDDDEPSTEEPSAEDLERQEQRWHEHTQEHQVRLTAQRILTLHNQIDGPV